MTRGTRDARVRYLVGVPGRPGAPPQTPESVLTHHLAPSRPRAVVSGIAFALTLMLLPASLAAQGLPAPQALAARHDSIVGGRAALEGRRSMRMVGSFTIPDAGIEAPLEILKLRPNKYLFRSTLGPMGELLSGYDGTNAWAVQPGAGAMLMQGESARQLADQADFFGDLHDYSRFATVETLDEAEFDGRRVHRVRMVRASGDTLMEFFDAATGLTAGSETSVETPMGRMKTTSIVGDYRDFNGLKIATRLEQRNPQFRVVITIASVEFDTLDEAAVDPPESVKALIKP